MNVVEDILALKSAGTLNYERLLEKKELGRPKPIMDLKQTTKDRCKDIKRYFKESMYNLSDWICGCNVKNAFFCYPCLLFSDDSLWARSGVTDIKHLKDKIKRHTSSVAHINCSMSYTTLGHVDIKQEFDCDYQNSVRVFNESVCKNRYVLNRIIDCVKFCGVLEIELGGNDESAKPGIFQCVVDFVSELDSIFKDHLEISTVFKKITQTLRDNILDSILAVVHNHVIKEIAETDFVAVQVDETTDSSNQPQMIFIFRYVFNGVVYERFWKFVRPLGTTTQHLTDAILEELRLSKLDESPHKLIAQSYESASEASGKLGGVQTKIKETYSNAQFIHCYAHELHLVLQKAASRYKSIKNFFANLNACSTFFVHPKRSAVLKMRLSKAAQTQCGFNTKSVQTIHTYKNELLYCLNKIIHQDEDSDNIDQATNFKHLLEDDLFLFWLDFFNKIIPLMDILFEQLQMPDNDLELIKIYMTSFNKKIKKVQSTILESAEPNTLIPKRRKTDDNCKRTAVDVCDIIKSEIRLRFNFNDYLMISELFLIERFEVYTRNFPEKNLKMVSTNYSTINISKLRAELEVIYIREDFRNSGSVIAILRFFINMNLSETFSESLKLLNILCTLPMATMESDRCFSTLKDVKAFLHNTTGQSRLTALCTLSTERKLIKNISNFNEQVIDHFAEQNRGINLQYK